MLLSGYTPCAIKHSFLVSFLRISSRIFDKYGRELTCLCTVYYKYFATHPKSFLLEDLLWTSFEYHLPYATPFYSRPALANKQQSRICNIKHLYISLSKNHKIIGYCSAEVSVEVPIFLDSLILDCGSSASFFLHFFEPFTMNDLCWGGSLALLGNWIWCYLWTTLALSYCYLHMPLDK